MVDGDAVACHASALCPSVVRDCPRCCDLNRARRCEALAGVRERVVTTKKDTSMSFENLGLQEAITRAVRDAGYTQATDVQQHAIGPALNGADLMVGGL